MPWTLRKAARKMLTQNDLEAANRPPIRRPVGRFRRARLSSLTSEGKREFRDISFCSPRESPTLEVAARRKPRKSVILKNVDVAQYRPCKGETDDSSQQTRNRSRSRCDGGDRRDAVSE